MSARYWIVNESVVGFEDTTDEVCGVVTAEDTTGRWQKYLAWIAEGNTPEEWTAE